MRILVTDSDTRSALAAVRTLGRQRHEVITAGERHPSLASASRYSTRFETYPNPGADAPGFVRALVEIATRNRIEVVLPMTEITTLLATEHQEQLPAGCRLPFASPQAVRNASDKAYVMRLAQARNVPIPRTIFASSAADALVQAAGESFPLVIKPARSRVRVGSGWISTSVSYAHDHRMLTESLERLPDQAYPVLLQERIVGPGVGLFACYDRGRPIARFAHQRLREKPPSGGVSVLCRSAPIDPLAAEYADRLLTALQWSGVAMVEFKRDERDGSLRLMEINGRFWGSLQLAIDAGVDFPALLVAIAAGQTPPPVSDYRHGVSSRWFWGDVDALLMLLLHSQASLNLPPGHPGRWRTLREFLRLSPKTQRDEMFRREDLGPWWLETRRWLLGR